MQYRYSLLGLVVVTMVATSLSLIIPRLGPGPIYSQAQIAAQSSQEKRADESHNEAYQKQQKAYALTSSYAIPGVRPYILPRCLGGDAYGPGSKCEYVFSDFSSSYLTPATKQSLAPSVKDSAGVSYLPVTAPLFTLYQVSGEALKTYAPYLYDAKDGKCAAGKLRAYLLIESGRLRTADYVADRSRTSCTITKTPKGREVYTQPYETDRIAFPSAGGGNYFVVEDKLIILELNYTASLQAVEKQLYGDPNFAPELLKFIDGIYDRPMTLPKQQ